MQKRILSLLLCLSLLAGLLPTAVFADTDAPVTCEEHDFSQDPSQCGNCGFKRGASVESDGNLTNCETLTEAIDIAAEEDDSDTVVTVYGGEDCFPSELPIVIEKGKFTVDFNGADLSFGGKSLFEIKSPADVTLKNGKIDLSGDTKYNDNPGIFGRSGKLTLENLDITSSCNTYNGHVQHPAVKVLAGCNFTANNVVFGGGFEARSGAGVTPFTNCSFVYTCPDAANNYPLINCINGIKVTDIIADGFALAEYGNEKTLVPMYDFNTVGVYAAAAEIWDSVTVVSHPGHTFDWGYCGCGYKCYHEGGFDADGICPICGAHAAASVGGEMFTELVTAFEKASELAKTDDNVTVNIIYDLGDLYDTGYAAGKITVDLNGHDLASSKIYSGKEDEDGNVIAEGDLTVIDSSESKSGVLGSADLLGGKLTVREGDVYSVEAGDGEANIYGSKILNVAARGGKTNVFGGEISQLSSLGGETHISGGLTNRLRVSGGKTYVTGGTITDFGMSGGEIYISDGDFDKTSVDIAYSDNTNPKLEITGGNFDDASFTAETKGRIAISGGIFKKITVNSISGSNVNTVGDLLADGYMFYSADGSVISGNTNILSESAEVKRHDHSYTNGVCDICGLPCKHTDVSDGGICADCKAEFGLQLITKDGASSYYIGFKDALTAANLEENKGCTVKLYKDITMTQAERFIDLEGGEFTIDLNGYAVSIESPTELTHVTPYIMLTDVNLTLMTSAVRGMWSASFYPFIQIYEGAVFKCRHDYADSYLYVSDINFINDETTGRISFGPGVYVSNLNKPDAMTAGDVLEEGCVFQNENDIISRSATGRMIWHYFVVKCPHEWDGNKCKYCGLFCDHPNGYKDGVCPDCGRACEHKNIDENSICKDCKLQMTVKTETAGAAVTYGTDLSAALNAAEDGTTVTLLTDTELGENVYIYGSEKTVTLDLNGHSVGGRAFCIGVSSDAKVKYGTLKIIGSGKIQTELSVVATGTLDLGGWTGGEIKKITVCQNSSVTGSIPAGAYIEAIDIAYFARETMDKIDEIKLDGGSYGTITWLNSVNVDFPLGILLAPGYAFRKEDNTIVPYTYKLSYAAINNFIQNVMVVKCEEHYDGDEDGKCDYCNTQLAASVVGADGVAREYFTDINEAVNAQLKLGSSYTVKLLRDFPISITMEFSEGSPRFDLNGHSVDHMWFKLDCRATIIGDGTLNYLAFSNNAGLTSAAPKANIIWIMDGATWSSILPGASFGYKVYSKDGSSYTWYKSDSVGEIASSDRISGAAVEELPITEEPILMLGGTQLENGRAVRNDEGLKFSVALPTSGAKCMVHYKKINDDLIKNESMDIYNSGRYESEFTSFFSAAGDYEVWAVVTKDGYECKTEVFRITSKNNFAGAVITLDNDEFTYEYPGTPYTVSVASVTFNGETVPETDYTVSGELTGTDAKTYTVTVTANKNSSYIGSATVKWAVKPCVLTGIEACTYIKNYDGTTEITADNIGKNDSPLYFYYNGCPAGGIMLEYGADYYIDGVKSNFSGPNAEEYGDVTFTAVLKNSNYTFKDNYGADVTFKTFSEGMYIGKATGLPSGCEPDGGELTVRNGAEHTYTYDVSKLLKELPNGLNYGTTRYEPESIGSADNGYITDGTVSIGADGILTVPVKSVNTEVSEEIAIVKVKVTTQNYDDFTVTVTVRAKNRIVPTGKPELDKSEITYGDKIGSIKLSGKMHDGETDVDGEFTWNKPDVQPNAGDYESEWTFTPTGDNAYMYAPVIGKTTVKVNKAPFPNGKITVLPASAENLKYDGGREMELITAGETEIGTMQYRLGEDGEWKAEIPTAANAGSYDVYYRATGDANRKESDPAKVTCVISKREVEIANKSYRISYVYGSIIPDPQETDFEITGSESGASFSYEWIDAKPENNPEPGKYRVKVTVGETDNTLGGFLIVDISITQKNDTEYIGGTDYEVYNNTDKVSYDVDFKSPLMDLGSLTVKDIMIKVRNGLNQPFVDYDEKTCDFRINVTEGTEKGKLNVELSDLGRDITGTYFCLIAVKAQDNHYADIYTEVRLILKDKAQKTLNVSMNGFTYGGNASAPVYTAPEGTLKSSVTYAEKDGTPLAGVPTETGEYTVTVICETKDTVYSGSADFAITQRPISDLTVSLDKYSFIYNGAEQKPTVTAEMNDAALTENDDYTVIYPTDMTNAGTKEIKVRGMGNFSGEKIMSYRIDKATVNVRPKDITKIYGGEPVFGLVGGGGLITDKELADLADNAEFTSDGAAKTAPVTENGYEISAKLKNNETDNLIINVSGTGILTVKKAQLTVTVNDVSREYGAENPELSVSYGGFVNGDDESVLEGTLTLAYDESINAAAFVGTHIDVTTASGLTAQNYDIKYVPGSVTVTKIPVNASAGDAKRSYLTVVFDRDVPGLTQANFAVYDSDNNSVAVTNATASADSKSYTLSGSFTPGKEYKVTVTLKASPADETHSLENASFTVTPVRSGGSGGGGASRYTVKFNSNGGSKIADQLVAGGSAVIEPKEPTKDGFDFAGWYTDKELTAKYDFSAKVTKSFMLYAAWAEVKSDDAENQIIFIIGKKEASVFGSVKANDVAPQIVNGRTMLPARFVAENLGAEVSWDGEKRLVTITGKHLKTGDEITILISVGSDIAYVNGEEIKLDSPAFIENDRTYTPVRFISEELGAKVEWIESEQKVVITK